MLSVSENSFATKTEKITSKCLKETRPLVEGVIKDCENVLAQADTVIREQELQLSLQRVHIDNQLDELDQLHRELELQKAAKNSWYTNPWVMIGIGILAGGAGALTLSR